MNTKTTIVKPKKSSRKNALKLIAIKEISKSINKSITEKYIKPLLNDSNYR